VGKPISDLRLRIADLTSRSGHSAIRSQLVGRAGLEPAKAEPADFIPTTAFAANLRCLWAGLCLHPVWMLPVKSLHLPPQGLGSALPSPEVSPNLRSFHLQIPL